ncbi:MAG: hypothetical protein ACYSSP_12985 [Planctomycetota bacterium]
METNLYDCIMKDMVVWESSFLLRRRESNRVPVLKCISRWVLVSEVDVDV